MSVNATNPPVNNAGTDHEPDFEALFNAFVVNAATDAWRQLALQEDGEAEFTRFILRKQVGVQVDFVLKENFPGYHKHFADQFKQAKVDLFDAQIANLRGAATHHEIIAQ
ncbi:MAG: hypothetical protein ACRYGP_08210 [Janthinobacterium lividum]